MENADRQEAPPSAFQIDVELLGRHFARPAGNDRYQRRAVGGHDIRQFELAGRELSEIIVEPPGERRIHVGDRAVWLRREKAGGRVVEIVDHMLQVLKKAFVPFAFARDVGDGPERRVVFCDAFERAHPDAIPGRAAFAGQRRRDAQFLDAAFAGAGRLRETVDRFGNVGRARKQPLDGTQVRRALGGGEGAIGVVGVEHARMGVGDDQAIVVAVRDRLRGVQPAGAARELKQAEGVHQEPEHAENRQYGDRRRHRLAADLPGQHDQGADRDHEADEQQQEQAWFRRAFDLIDGGGGGRRRWVHTQPFLPRIETSRRTPTSARPPNLGPREHASARNAWQ